MLKNLFVLSLIISGSFTALASGTDFQCYNVVSDIQIAPDGLKIDRFEVSGNRSLILLVALESQRSGKPTSIHLDTAGRLDGISIDRFCTGLITPAKKAHRRTTPSFQWDPPLGD